MATKFPVWLIWDVYPRSWIPDPNVSHPGSRILDPNFFHPGSLIPDLNFFHPGAWITHIKEFKCFNQKNGFSALRNMIQVFHPGSGSRIWILTFYLSRIPILDPRSRIQGSKRHRIPVGFGFATQEISGLLRL